MAYLYTYNLDMKYLTIFFLGHCSSTFLHFKFLSEYSKGTILKMLLYSKDFDQFLFYLIYKVWYRPNFFIEVTPSLFME